MALLKVFPIFSTFKCLIIVLSSKKKQEDQYDPVLLTWAPRISVFSQGAKADSQVQNTVEP